MVKTWLVIPDLHYPYVDKLYVKLITAVIKKVRPYGIVQLGDAVDCFQISKYPKNPERLNSVFDDVIDYRLQMIEWHELCGGYYWQLEGNHENRLERFIWEKSPQINKLVRTIPELLDIGKITGTKWFPLRDWRACQIGDATLHHGVFYSQHVAAGNLARYPTKLLTGHVHRLQYVSNGERWSCVLGHGSDETLTSHNATPTGWQQAFGLLHNVNGVCEIEVVPVAGGKCTFRGEVLSGKK